MNDKAVYSLYHVKYELHPVFPSTIHSPPKDSMIWLLGNRWTRPVPPWYSMMDYISQTSTLNHPLSLLHSPHCLY